MCKKYSYADIIRLVIKQASENSGILVSDINIDNNIFDDLGMDEVDFWDFRRYIRIRVRPRRR